MIFQIRVFGTYEVMPIKYVKRIFFSKFMFHIIYSFTNVQNNNQYCLVTAFVYINIIIKHIFEIIMHIENYTHYKTHGETSGRLAYMVLNSNQLK